MCCVRAQTLRRGTLITSQQFHQSNGHSFTTVRQAASTRSSVDSTNCDWAPWALTDPTSSWSKKHPTRALVAPSAGAAPARTAVGKERGVRGRGCQAWSLNRNNLEWIFRVLFPRSINQPKGNQTNRKRAGVPVSAVTPQKVDMRLSRRAEKMNSLRAPPIAGGQVSYRLSSKSRIASTACTGATVRLKMGQPLLPGPVLRVAR